MAEFEPSQKAQTALGKLQNKYPGYDLSIAVQKDDQGQEVEVVKKTKKDGIETCCYPVASVINEL